MKWQCWYISQHLKTGTEPLLVKFSALHVPSCGSHMAMTFCKLETGLDPHPWSPKSSPAQFLLHPFAQFEPERS